MKKALTYSVAGLLAVAALFFGFTTTNFFSYMGASVQALEVVSLINAILLMLAIVCVSVMLVSGVIMLVRKDYTLMETLMLKWLAVAAFALVAITLVLNYFFNTPATVTFTSIIGYGAIAFLAATALSALVAFLIKEEE
jgi:hypothetical protein